MKHFYAFGIIPSNSSLCDPMLKTADWGKLTEFAYSEESLLLKLVVTSRQKAPLRCHMEEGERYEEPYLSCTWGKKTQLFSKKQKSRRLSSVTLILFWNHRERSSRLITIKTVTSSRKKDVLEKNGYEALRFLKADHLEFDKETGRSSECWEITSHFPRKLQTYLWYTVFFF